jgi:hypothetical protein
VLHVDPPPRSWNYHRGSPKGVQHMRRNQRFRTGVVMAVALLVVGAAGAASARPKTVDTTAKLAPKPVRGGEQVLYRTSFTSTKRTITEVNSTTTFDPITGATIDRYSPQPTCTPAGAVLNCGFGKVKVGTTLDVSIVATLPDVLEPVTVVVPTVWQFKDAGGGQPGQAESFDSTTVYPSEALYVNGGCLSNTGGEDLSASLGDASIAFATPAFRSILCVPLGLQVSPRPPGPVECFPGRACSSEVLTSFAGVTFLAGTPAEGSLVWPGSSVADKRAPVVFNDGVRPPLLVPHCSTLHQLSAENPACEVDGSRSFAQDLVAVRVRWLGNDPTWQM